MDKKSFCFDSEQVDRLAQLVKHELIELDILLEVTCLSDSVKLLIVYFNKEKPLFKRVVLIPDAFDIKSYVSNIKSIFGENAKINIIIT